MKEVHEVDEVAEELWRRLKKGWRCEEVNEMIGNE